MLSLHSQPSPFPTAVVKKSILTQCSILVTSAPMSYCEMGFNSNFKVREQPESFRAMVSTFNSADSKVDVYETGRYGPLRLWRCLPYTS